MLGERSTVPVVCQHLEVTEQTYYRRHNEPRRIKVDDAKRSKNLKERILAQERLMPTKPFTSDATVRDLECLAIINGTPTCIRIDKVQK